MLPERVIEGLRGLHGAGAVGMRGDDPKHSVRAPRKAELPGVVGQSPSGPYWHIDRPLVSLLPHLADDLRQVAQHGGRRVAADRGEPDADRLALALEHRTLFLDLETCGFSGAMVFLIGLIRATPNGLTVTQLLARDYSEEKAILEAMWTLAARHELLVTFNGKSFDWPFIHDRSTLHHLGRDPRHGSVRKKATLVTAPVDAKPLPAGMERPRERCGDDPPAMATLDRFDPRPDLHHIDLLHVARKKWRGQVPNCRLQTLEQRFCGRFRVADISGQDIPLAYRDFVESRDTEPMHSILHHNALDLITMVQIAVRWIAER